MFELLLICGVLLPIVVLESMFALGVDGWAVIVIGLAIRFWLRSAPPGEKRGPRFPAYESVIRSAAWVGVVANFLTLGINHSFYDSHECPFFCPGDIRMNGDRILSGFPWGWWPSGRVDIYDFVPLPARFLGNVLVYGLIAVAVQFAVLKIWQRIKKPVVEPKIAADAVSLWGPGGPPTSFRDRLLATGILAGVVAVATMIAVPLLWGLQRLLIPLDRLFI